MSGVECGTVREQRRQRPNKPLRNTPGAKVWEEAQHKCVCKRLFGGVGVPFRSGRKAGQGGKMKPTPPADLMKHEALPQSLKHSQESARANPLNNRVMRRTLSYAFGRTCCMLQPLRRGKPQGGGAVLDGWWRQRRQQLRQYLQHTSLGGDASTRQRRPQTPRAGSRARGWSS